MGRSERDIVPAEWTTSNVTEDRSIDANSGDVNVVSDGLCTLIEDLKKQGVLK
tara:strand:- start:449 stop:607 length:159 start_codon:yes stop_codon:yes gene_type:complete